MISNEAYMKEAKDGTQRLLRDPSRLTGPFADVVGENLIHYLVFICRWDVEWVLAELRNRDYPVENRLQVVRYLANPHRDPMLAELQGERPDP